MGLSLVSSEGRQKDHKKQVMRFIKDDLEHRLCFIDESLQYKDYKPFLTDMWDAVILSGKQRFSI